MWKNNGIARNSVVMKAVCTSKNNVLAIGRTIDSPSAVVKPNVISLPPSNPTVPADAVTYLSPGGRCVFFSPNNSNEIYFNPVLNSGDFLKYTITDTLRVTGTGYLTDANFYWVPTIIDSINPTNMMVLPVGGILPTAYQIQLVGPSSIPELMKISSFLIYHQAPDGKLFGYMETVQDTRLVYKRQANLVSISPALDGKAEVKILGSVIGRIRDIYFVNDQNVYVMYNDDYNNPGDLRIWLGPIDTLTGFSTGGIVIQDQQYRQCLYANKILYLLTESYTASDNRFSLYTIPMSGTTNSPGLIKLPPEPVPGHDVDDLAPPGWTKPPVVPTRPNLTFYNWVDCALVYNNQSSEVGVAVGLNVSKSVGVGLVSGLIYSYSVDTIFYALCEDGYCVDVTATRQPCTKQPRRNLCRSKCKGNPDTPDTYWQGTRCDYNSDSSDCKSEVWDKCATANDVSQWVDGDNIYTLTPNAQGTVVTDPRGDGHNYSCGSSWNLYSTLSYIKDFYQNSNPDTTMDSLCMMNPTFLSSLDENSTTYQPFVCDYTSCVANRQVSIADLVSLRQNLNAKYPDPTVQDKNNTNTTLSADQRKVQSDIDEILTDLCTKDYKSMKSTPCQDFCKRVDLSTTDTQGKCDAAVTEYCKDSEPSAFCSCFQSKQFLSECFDSTCTNQGGYYTQPVQKFLEGGCPSVCQTVIDVNKAGGNVNINDNTFNIRCTQEKPSSGAYSEGFGGLSPAAAVKTPVVGPFTPDKWYGVGSDGKCGELASLDSSKSSEYRECLANNDPETKIATCEEKILTGLKLPDKKYKSLSDCEKAGTAHTLFLVFAILNFIVAILMVSFGVVRREKALWATGIGFVLVAIGLSVAAAK